MYNSKIISDFIEMVNKEAESAANEVFKKYETDFINKVKGQMKKGEKLYLTNGSAYFEDDKNETEAKEKFRHEVAQIQYLKQRASFTSYYFIK